MLPKINIIKMPFDLLLCAAFPMSENFLHFRVSETEIRQYGKACIVPIFKRTARRKVLNSLELLGFRISVSGFEFANFSAMMRARSNDRRFAE